LRRVFEDCGEEKLERGVVETGGVGGDRHGKEIRLNTYLVEG